MSTVLSHIALGQGVAADLATVDAIMADAFDSRFGEAWTHNQCLGIVAMPGVTLTLATLDGAAAGFALVRRIIDEVELLLIATRPEMRRRGVASALLRGAIAAARDQGIARLHLEMRDGNDALKLYRRHGFVKVGERRNYYRGANGQSFHALTYSLDLR